jgi:hypothetical protein
MGGFNNMLNQILNQLYMYYPRNEKYNSIGYHNSKERSRLLKKWKYAKNNKKHKSHFFMSLRKIFCSYEVIDWSDLEEYFDYEYRVLLHKNQSILDDDIGLMNVLHGKRSDLYIFISVLERYFCFFLVYTRYDSSKNACDAWCFKDIYENIQEIRLDIKKELDELLCFFLKNGYALLPYEIYTCTVPYVETELKENNTARVFDCLFNDMML